MDRTRPKVHVYALSKIIHKYTDTIPNKINRIMYT